MDYTYSQTLSLRKGYLFCEDVGVRDVQDGLRAVQTPCSPFFMYSKAQLRANVLAYKTALQEGNIPHLLGYSIKANYSPHVLAMVREFGCTAAVAVSGNEIILALRVGFKPQNIVFNGNGKQLWEVELAVQNECLLNVDSEFDFHHVVRVAAMLGKKARVLLRLNPDIDPVSKAIHIAHCV